MPNVSRTAHLNILWNLRIINVIILILILIIIIIIINNNIIIIIIINCRANWGQSVNK